MPLTTERPDRIRPAPAAPTPASPVRAALRRPLLVILPVVALAALAVVVGQLRKPTYTAESRVAIGSFNPSQDAAPGAAYAGTQFAAAYSRAIGAHDVVAPVARQTGVPAGAVAGRVTATPIPDSPMLRIDGTGPSADAAIKMTNAATQSLLAYVRRSDVTGARATDVLNEFRAAQADASRAHNKVDIRQKAVDREPDSDSAQRALDKSQTRADTLDLRVKALRTAYLQQAQSESSGIPVRTLNAAGAASSDASKSLKLLVTIGVLAGLAIGVALATAFEAGSARRRSARA